MRAILIAVAVLCVGCGADDPAPAFVTATYETLSPDGPCVQGYCATRRWGAGTVKNIGESVAYTVKIHIRTACENYAVYSTPQNLGPGMSGVYETGLYFGCEAESVGVSWDEL